jgi:hypothetical protein
MELRQPPPVRRLDPGSSLTPRSPEPATANGATANGAAANGATTNGATANGAAANGATTSATGASFVAAPRSPREITATIDRMAVEQVSISYGQRAAVKSVSLPIRQGEVLALIGPSGCGKTTLLRSLNRLTELTKTASLSGRITLDGTDVSMIEQSAAPGDDGVPAAQPVPDERVRQRRLRPARAGQAPAAPGRAAGRGGGRAGPGRSA